jgi:DNA-binding response OmpR family regulator
MKRILLVEDMPEFQKLVKRTLDHCSVTAVGNVREALSQIQKSNFDLILLDINLPQDSGYTLLSELRSAKILEQVPVICLTSKSEISDKLTAFSLGAQDYLVKPFDPLELRARVDIKIKSDLNRSPTFLRSGGLEIDLATHRVFDLDRTRAEVKLTQTEFKLLCTLAKAEGRVLTRDQLLVAVWGEDARVNDRAVDVHLCGLRKKLSHKGSFVESVTGVGYRFTPRAFEQAGAAA